MTATPRDDPRHERRIALALAGWRRGWSFTPLDGKRPILPGWPSRPRETMEELTAWTRAGNVGLRTGKASGIVVVDVDLLDGETSYDAWKRAQQVGCVPTVTAVTGAGGLHLYYASPKNSVVANSAGKLAPHIDVRGEGGQVVFVGGTHPKTGAPYHWADHLSPDDIDVADLPASTAHGLDHLEGRLRILGEDAADLCGVVRLGLQAQAQELVAVILGKDGATGPVDGEGIALAFFVRHGRPRRHVDHDPLELCPRSRRASKAASRLSKLLSVASTTGRVSVARLKQSSR